MQADRTDRSLDGMNEEARVRAIKDLEFLEPKPDSRLDHLVETVARIFQTPAAGASLVGKEKLWFKASTGIDMTEVRREDSFCAQVVEKRSTIVVPDATVDETFKDNPYVRGKFGLRFYAGAPIFGRGGAVLGALCILDTKARDYLTVDEIAILESIANIVSEAMQNPIGQELRDGSRIIPRRHALIAMDTLNGVWEWLRGEENVYFSANCHPLLGLPEAELLAPASYWLDRVHPEDRRAVLRLIAKQSHGHENTFEIEHRVRHVDTGWRWVKALGFLSRDEHGRCDRIVGSFMDVTNIRAFDALTGMPNRSTFVDKLADVLQIAVLGGDTKAAVLMVEVNRFARIINRFGTAQADRILRDIGQRLTNTVSHLQTGRRSMVARNEGDTFLILLDHVEDASEAEALAKRIQDALNVPFACDGYPIQVHISVGLALARKHHRPHHLIENAMVAVKQASSQGRGTCVVFTPKMLEESTMAARLESELRDAIEHGELRVFYQPQFDLRTGSLNGCEALVRWQHPQFGLLFPDVFLPLAEENGLISEIDRWVMRTACEQMAGWKRRYPSASQVKVSVNVSSHKFSELRLQSTILNLLKDTGLEPSTLCLEVTETVLMRDVEDAIPILQSLRQIGVGLHIDDFGSGYSSFAQLYGLPFDTLKIDRSFMRKVLVDNKALAIVEAIIGLARRLGLSVIAEGVEEDGHRRLLQQLGCDNGQGYFYSRPITASEFEEKLFQPFGSTDPQEHLLHSLAPVPAAVW